MRGKKVCGVVSVCLAMAAAGPAAAWGDTGHKVTALIAYQRLTPKAKAAVDAMLAADTDTLTAPDFASRATWADKYRTSQCNTAEWHFVDVEITNPDIAAASLRARTAPDFPVN